jgi:glyoxylase-like metal-dependent hydrolase (beta-lactamase superfamily II)
MKTHQVAPGLRRISLVQSDLVNAYIADNVLIDAGGTMGRKKLLALLENEQIAAHALTHAHFDHQGGSHAVCERFEIPLFCGEGDRRAMETGDFASLASNPRSIPSRIVQLISGPAHPVERALSEGDEVGGFAVVETPGHTPGHLAFWRESDGVLICGDVLFHRNPVTLRRGLAEPFGFATHDVAMNRESARKLAALRPRVICFGHGAPLVDGDVFCRFVAGLPGAANSSRVARKTA